MSCVHSLPSAVLRCGNCAHNDEALVLCSFRARREEKSVEDSSARSNVVNTAVPVPVLLTHPDRNTQNERRATQSNTRQRTQGKQNQRSRNNTSKPKTNTADPEHYSKPPTTENRNLRTNRKPLPSKPPTEAYLPQPHRPSQPNLPRTTLDPTRHPRQHRTRTSNVQAPHGITPCGVCARYSAA